MSGKIANVNAIVGNVRDTHTTTVNLIDGSYRLAVNITEPYAVLAITTEGVIATGVNKPVSVKNNEIMLPVEQKRIRIQKDFLDSFYKSVAGVRVRDHGTDISVCTYFDAKENFSYKAPSGIDYVSNGPKVAGKSYPVKTGIKIETKVATRRTAHLRKIIRKSDEERLVVVSATMTGEKSFILIEDYDPACHMQASVLHEVQNIFGKSLTYFPTGTVQFICQANEVMLPVSWLNINDPDRKGVIIRKHSKKDAFLIIPAVKRKCLVDGKKLDPTEWKGKDGVLCPDCAGCEDRSISEGPYAEALDIIDEFLNRADESDFIWLAKIMNEMMNGKEEY